MENFKINLNIEETKKTVLNKVNINLRDMAETTTELAKDKSPVLTGHNKSTITWDQLDNKFRVYTQSGYGGFLELGTARQMPQPYIMPAYNEAKSELEQNLEGSI